MFSRKISIITAVYNNVHTIANSIDSTLNQSYPNIELVVVDGGSTDGTLELLKSYGDKIHTLISEPDNGIYDALNKGIHNATGDIVGFMHSDDEFQDSDVLNRVAKAFKKHKVDSIYGDLLYVNREDTSQVIRYWKSGEYCRTRLSQGWMPPHPTFYMKRIYYQQFGGFDLQYKIAADYDSLLRYLGRHNISTHYIPEVLVRMRVGGASNRSIKNIILKSQEDYRALKINEVGGKRALFMKNVSKIPQFLFKNKVRHGGVAGARHH